MEGDVASVRRLDNPATGLLVGLLALAAQAVCFLDAAARELGNAPGAITATVAGGFVLALVLWSRGARWSAGWVLAMSSVWAYLAGQLAAFWPGRF